MYSLPFGASGWKPMIACKSEKHDPAAQPAARLDKDRHRLTRSRRVPILVFRNGRLVISCVGSFSSKRQSRTWCGVSNLPIPAMSSAWGMLSRSGTVRRARAIRSSWRRVARAVIEAAFQSQHNSMVGAHAFRPDVDHILQVIAGSRELLKRLRRRQLDDAAKDRQRNCRTSGNTRSAVATRRSACVPPFV